jgi:ribosome-interacting GTPase 1
MPANLTPVYHEAERQFQQATTIPEKIEALQQMLAVIPKHKGTEHMRAELRRRLSKLRQEAQEAGRRQSGREALTHVERQGAGQAVLAGAPNTGKSSLVGALTHAHPAVAEYPFTTQLPAPGMMPYGGIQIQLVDAPPITPEYYEPWQGDLTRRADIALLVADLAEDALLDQVEGVLDRLRQSKVVLTGERLPEGASGTGFAQVTTLLVANKCDAPGAEERHDILAELYGDRFPFLRVSARTGEGLEALRDTLFRRLEILRVFSKPPGKPPDLEAPFVLKRGSTLLDFAGTVHKEFLTGLKSARIWGSPLSAHPSGSAKYAGQAVERDHLLEDGDVVELHR